MQATAEGIPVLEIGGKDYGMTKLPGKYLFTDEDTNAVLIAEAAAQSNWTLTTEQGRAGNLCCEGSAWVLYEGPIRTRHVIPHGLDNAMIKAAEIILKKEATR